MQFQPGPIAGVIWKPLKKYHDTRGWLCELFRQDEMAAEFHPVMAYVSLTEPGVARGPHEHAHQADCFCIIGPSHFKMLLWDNRKASPTYGHFETDTVGEDKPMLLIIPPGVVHAYKNVGSLQGLILNCPNRLYKGHGRNEAVDEIRHEEDWASPFRLE